MSSFTVQVVRFTPVYPKKDPDSYIVGFSITCEKNKRTIYREKRIMYKDIKSLGLTSSLDEKIVQLAWEKIEPTCKNWCKESLHQGSIKKKSFSI